MVKKKIEIILRKIKKEKRKRVVKERKEWKDGVERRIDKRKIIIVMKDRKRIEIMKRKENSERIEIEKLRDIKKWKIVDGMEWLLGDKEEKRSLEIKVKMEKNVDIGGLVIEEEIDVIDRKKNSGRSWIKEIMRVEKN